MSTERRSRAQLLQALTRQARINAMRAVMFQHALALRAGLNITDFNCLNILGLDGPMTPGQLAERVGLTRGGAITAVIDRLERAGYVQRHRGQRDRRQVIVKLVEEVALPQIRPHFASFVAAWEAHLDRYGTDELALLVDFTARSGEVIHEATLTLWEDAAPSSDHRGGAGGTR